MPGVSRWNETEILKHKSNIRNIIKFCRDRRRLISWDCGVDFNVFENYVQYGILEKADPSYTYKLTKKFKEFLKDCGISINIPNQDIVDFLKFEPVHIDVKRQISEIEYRILERNREIGRLRNLNDFDFKKIDKLKSKLSCVNRRVAREKYRKLPITRNMPSIDDICESLQDHK